MKIVLRKRKKEELDENEDEHKALVLTSRKCSSPSTVDTSSMNPLGIIWEGGGE